MTLTEEFDKLYRPNGAIPYTRLVVLPSGNRVRWCVRCEQAKPLIGFPRNRYHKPLAYCSDCVQKEREEVGKVECTRCGEIKRMEHFHLRQTKEGVLPIQPCHECEAMIRSFRYGDSPLEGRYNTDAMPPINKRIYELVERKCGGNVSLFCRHIDVSVGAMGRLFGVQHWGKYQQPSWRILNKILSYYSEVSAEWLMRG